LINLEQQAMLLKR